MVVVGWIISIFSFCLSEFFSILYSEYKLLSSKKKGGIKKKDWKIKLEEIWRKEEMLGKDNRDQTPEPQRLKSSKAGGLRPFEDI